MWSRYTFNKNDSLYAALARFKTYHHTAAKIQNLSGQESINAYPTEKRATPLIGAGAYRTKTPKERHTQN
jgi:hypothetical protein